MGECGYKIRNKEAIHFITFTVVGWIDVFTRPEYCEIFLNSIKYCQKEKGLLLHAWCLMTNHTHMAISLENKDSSDILRDFKKFTSRRILEAIQNNPEESRKPSMLSLFADSGKCNIRNSEFQFWQQDNHPKEMWSDKFTKQKVDYIHWNPVKAGIVSKPEDYRYSSAIDYYSDKNCGLLKIDFL